MTCDHESVGATRRRLDVLERQVNCGIALGVWDAFLASPLAVRDGQGSYPVVAVLADEPAGMLIERVAAIGSAANVFVGRGDGSIVAGVMHLSDIPANPANPADSSNPSDSFNPIDHHDIQEGV